MTKASQIPSPIKILLVDDQNLVRYGLSNLLNTFQNVQISVVGYASTGNEAINFIRDNPVDLVLLDINMPGLCGLETTERILRVNKDIKVLLMTALPNEIFASRALKSGAAGYIAKGVPFKELVNAIRIIMSDMTYVPDKVASGIVLSRVQGEEELPFDGLNNRELETLLMITQGLGTNEISELYSRSSKTVSGYGYATVKKVRRDNIIQVLLLAIHHGLVDPDEAII